MQKPEEEIIPTMSEADQRIIDANVEIFNKTIALNNHRKGNVRMKILRRFLELPTLRSIFIYCLSGYAPFTRFEGEEDCSHWFLRTVVNKSDNNRAYIVIEQRCDGIWWLKHLIPIEAISNLKAEAGPDDKTSFNIFLTVPEVEKIPTPAHIPFHTPRRRT